MNKTYLLVICLLLTPFTGCIETVEEVDYTPSLRESVDRLYDYWNSRPYVTDSEWYCGIMVEPDGGFLNNSAKEECINERKEFYDSWYEYFDEGFEMKLIYSNYTEEEKMNYKGVVYEVTVDQKYCSRYNSTESWDCNSDYETIFLWALVDEKWGLAGYGLGEYLKEVRPIEQWTFYRDFGECDPDDNALVAYSEFVDWLNMDLVNDGQSVVAASSEFANEMFSMADLDMDGNLTPSEFVYIKNYPHEAVEEVDDTNNTEDNKPIEDGQNYNMTVVEIIDGDTFDLGNGERVRIIGINTPEKGRPFSDEATEVLSEMIMGREVTLVNDSKNDDSDSSGRLLRHVYVDDISVNYEMIRTGMAFWYPYSSGTDMDESYQEAQESAAENHVGLWTESQYNITIDYIEYDPEGSEADGEYLIITNHDNYNISMEGWYLQDEAARTAYKFNYTLEVDTSIRIYSGSGEDNETTLFWGWYQGIWNNDGDMAILQDENGLMVDYYRYGYD